ncbi:MAG: flagellar motor switch protein FliM [Clostridium argentinense]|uniref:Flagellar motor switch protein FliM n=1 Tax=Clostridium faecium TaxID=2762223 RepID=A0ABR8YPL8_9CLOT|nr:MULTISPECIES: flagellar motor switch protein FliM [Clostridium]MBD8045968.1 flagellar motor switch protein FliM [Clostridium faecium]MBS5823923.1 flagellar motor switch protein FliM [Clostridium argentinense]MDU1349518.1 flagellar motor switch protein FliM [Clostridium argentinense]
MSEVLSQNEIDALLNALSSGDLEHDFLEEKEEKVKGKPYDFRRPQKFSKDHIRTLELVHDNYSRIISNYLTAQLRSNIKVKVESVQQITYEEFIHSIPNPTVLTLFRMPPLSGQILLETNAEFVLRIYDVMAGGSGSKKPMLKELTEIEKNLIKTLNAGMISNLKLAWEDVLKVEPVIENIETNPALNQTLAPNEPVALITFTIEMFNTNVFMNICIPFLSLEKVLDKLVIQYWFREDNEILVKESREKLQKRLNVVDVDLKAVLGKAEITVKDFLELNVGDVINLNNNIEEPIGVYVEEQLTYIGKPGLHGKNRAVQILDFTDKDVEEDE